MDHLGMVVQDVGAILMEVEEGPYGSVGVRWHWGLATIGVVLLLGAAYREGGAGWNAHKQDSHMGLVEADAQGDQLAPWSQE